MKNIYLTGILFFCLQISYSQGYSKFGFSVGGGANYHVYHHPSFDVFVDTYNSALASKLKSNLTYLSPSVGGSISMEFTVGTIFRIGFARNFVKTKSIAEMNNGEQRIFALNMKEKDWYIDIMSPKEKKIKLGFAISSQNQRSTFYSSYIFNNGYESFVRGNDAVDLSGVYRAMSDATIGFGLRMDIELKGRFYLSNRFEYVGLGVVSKLLPHQDEMHANILSGSQFADGALPLYLPDDVHNAGNVYATTIGNQNVYGPFKGFRIQSTLNFLIWSKDVKD
jgi:hypothetical protein